MSRVGRWHRKKLWIARRIRMERTAWVGLFVRREAIAVGETQEICEDRARNYLHLSVADPLSENVSLEEVDVA